MKIETTDLREITDSDKHLTEVVVNLGYGESVYTGKVRWLVFGMAHLRKLDHCSGIQGWQLTAYLKDGATDFEHDYAYALRLPLVAVSLNGIRHHRTHLFAIVDENPDEFRVPLPGYNPLEQAEPCTSCSSRCPRHLIVPEGLYVPPFNAELFQAVKGKQVEIYIGSGW